MRRRIYPPSSTALLLILAIPIAAGAANSSGEHPRYSVTIPNSVPTFFVDTNSRGERAATTYDKNWNIVPCVISRKGTNLLSTLGGHDGFAGALNNHGQVVGGSYTSDWRWHACLWDNGHVSDLDSGYPGVSQAISINEKGQAVGEAIDSPYLNPLVWTRAMLWDDGDVIDLNDCIPHDLVWYVVEALYITNRGEIYAIGFMQGSDIDPFQMVVFLLTPHH